MTDFFAMNGYAAFIWPCYVLTFLFVAGLYLDARKKLKDSQK